MVAVVKKACGHLYRFLPLLAVGCTLVACDPPQKRALKELSQRGVEVTGKALLTAVQEGSFEDTRLLLQAGVHTGHCDAAGRSPLHLAVERDDVATATLLIDGGCDVNAVDSKGLSVLGYAMSAGDTALVGRLLDHGARANGFIEGNESFLSAAIRESRWADDGRTPETDGGSISMNREGEEANSLVPVAMQSQPRATRGQRDRKGDREWNHLIPKLVKAGADPNVPNERGVTPLEEAIQHRDLSLLELLLSSGGDPNHRNRAGDAPVHLILQAKWRDGLDALAKAHADFNLIDGKGRSPLACAMEAADRDLVDKLIHYGAKPPVGGWDGWLSKALASNDHVVVGQLLQMGASADRRDTDGRLPVEAAAMKGNGSMVRALLDFGAPAGDALYQVCAKGDHGMAGLLLISGVSPNPSRAPWLDTPIGAALRSQKDALALQLLQHGANPFLMTAEGQSPLHVAIALRQPRVVVALLAAGANPNSPFVSPANTQFLKHVKSGSMRWFLRSDRNVTPLMVAAASGEITTTRALMKAGAKLDVSTRVARYWPINFASNVGDISMMRVMLGRDPTVELRTIVISLSEQRARMYNQFGEEIFSTKVSTGREGYRTPTGEFAITNKYRDWKSTLYHAQMPFFLRLNCGDFGLHQGVVPGYAASHGCIRVPAGVAEKLYAMTETGDRVRIVP